MEILEYIYAAWCLFWFGIFFYGVGRIALHYLREEKKNEVCADCPFSPTNLKKERREGARRTTE